ncbi:MAG: glycine/sarcosine/betaine reductase selenoprotein B family protein [Rhodospirillales bacterium]
MVRLSDLPETDREHLLGKACPPFERQPWVTGPPLSKRRVALITTAGLQRRDDSAFTFNDTGYRVIPDTVDPQDLIMSHVSVNFDRTGFQQDINVVFPIERLHELKDEGVVGSIAKFHYAFMGAGSLPHEFEATARAVAGFLKQDRVDAVFLSPV